MVFESIIKASTAIDHPFRMFFVGIVYSSLALVLAFFVYTQFASLIMIFLTVLAASHVMFVAIKKEERKDLEIQEEKILLKEHARVLTFFMMMFLGFVVSFSLWFLFLPPDISANVFSAQTASISTINGLTGQAVGQGNMLLTIIWNNLRVLIFCLLFSFLYGIGAIFILAWNASIIGAAVGMFLRDAFGNQILLYPLALIRYLTHGVPEILAYFMAGLAGGIISIAIIRHDFGTDKSKHILLDSVDLIIAAVLVLLIAALLEVYVTPLMF